MYGMQVYFRLLNTKLTDRHSQRNTGVAFFTILEIFINEQMARFVHDVDDFEISDLGKPRVDIKRFYCDVTNKMKEDMKDAYDRLIGRKGTAAL